jgi:hypothetical protein
MDEYTVLSKGATVSFDGALIDNNLKDISFWIEKHNRYAIRELIDLMNEDYEFFSEHNLVGSSEQARSKRKKRSIDMAGPLCCIVLSSYLSIVTYSD